MDTSTETVLFLGKLSEAMRFSIWCSTIERPARIAPDRWEELLEAPRWITEHELAAVMDALYPQTVPVVLTTFPDCQQ